MGNYLSNVKKRKRKCSGESLNAEHDEDKNYTYRKKYGAVGEVHPRVTLTLILTLTLNPKPNPKPNPNPNRKP